MRKAVCSMLALSFGVAIAVERRVRPEFEAAFGQVTVAPGREGSRRSREATENALMTVK